MTTRPIIIYLGDTLIGTAPNIYKAAETALKAECRQLMLTDEDNYQFFESLLEDGEIGEWRLVEDAEGMIETFADKLQALRQEATDYIMSVVTARGDDYQLCDPNAIEPFIEDDEENELALETISDLPCIIGLEGEDNRIVSIDTDGTLCTMVSYPADDLLKIKTFSIYDGLIDTSTIIELADLITQLENTEA